MDELKVSKEIIEFEKLYDEKEMEILAVTDASGLGGGKGPKETFWTASIGILAWRENKEGSYINREKTFLRFQADDEFLDEMRNKIKKNSVVKLVVRRNENSFMLCHPLEYDKKDDELEEILAEELKPVVYIDDTFGKFNLDKSIDIFEKEINWCGENIRISFDNDEENEIESVLKTGHVLYKYQEKWMERICEFAAEELLELKNDCWLEDDEEEVTKEKFIEALELCDIVFESEGEFTFWFCDGDLFWGHSIIVEGNIDGTLNSAYIAG